MLTPIEAFLDQLEELVGMEGEYHLITERREAPGLWSIVFNDTPDVGSLTAFTYGLSSVQHPDWVEGRPELVLTVDSKDINWALALGFIAKFYRGKCPFSYGNVLRVGNAISDESMMSAFLLF